MKFSCYGLVLQLFAISLLFASESIAQKQLSVKEVFITIDVADIPLAEAFRRIEQQTNFVFNYDLRHIENQPTISLQGNRQSVANLLMEISEKANLKFKQVNNSINVEKLNNARNKKEQKLEIVLQSRNISGKVTSSIDDEPIPGVNVVEKGTTNGTVTNVNGAYTLSVNDNAVLVFSSVGYVSEEVAIGNKSVIDLVLSEDIQQLQELVVIGYGVQEKRDITGSVSSIEPKEFEDEPLANVTQGLQGKVAGVNVTTGSGAPGGNMIIRIRGNNSVIGSNDPLFVIDGVPVQGGSNGSTNILSTFNPGDIESIEVLKDASATAIYGSRGSNGVILITTRQGAAGGNSIEFETSFGYREIENSIEMMNSRQFAEIANERNLNDGLPLIFGNIDTLARVNTDWQEEIFRNAPIQNHSIRFSGGNNKTRYLISGNYFDEDGIIIGSDFKRGTVRLNLDQQVNEKFNLSGRFFVSRSVNNEVDDNSVLQSALNSPPFFPIYNPDGSYVNAAALKQFSFSPSSGDNPVAEALERTDRRVLDRILGSVTGSYTLFKGLTLNVLLGVDHLATNRDFYLPRILEGGLPAGVGSKSFSTTTSFLNENTLTYNNDFGGNGNKLTVTAGYTWQNEQSEFLTGASNGFVTDDLLNNILSAGELFSAPNNGFNEWVLVSWLGRINYILSDKYIFTLSGRADGSSRFGAGNKWGFFPSGAFAWRISDEPFFQNVTQVSNLKLRLSYGVSGNQAISPYQSLQRFTDISLAFGGTPTSGFAANNLGNPDLRWETTEEFNAGLEMGFMEERLRFSFDYYVKNTRDLLARVNLPPTSGFTTNIQNIGSTRNHGFEFQLGADIISSEKLNWDISFNGFRNINEVTETADGQDIIAPTIDIIGSANIVREGEPLSAYYGLRTNGLTEDGLYNFVDINNDGEIDDQDRVILGSPYPDWITGLTTGLTYGNFSLRVSLQGELGKTLWNNNKYRHHNSFHRGSNQVAEVATLRWTEDNPNPNAPYPKATSGLNQAPSDWFLEDASYLRLQNVRIGYNLPVSKLNLDFIKSLNIYLTGQNLLTFTQYDWYTPDINTFASGDLRIGIDQRTYPSARTFMMGLKIGF
jgi:TonB-linked SusC/RagA family outer membrane protein